MTQRRLPKLRRTRSRSDLQRSRTATTRSAGALSLRLVLVQATATGSRTSAQVAEPSGDRPGRLTLSTFELRATNNEMARSCATVVGLYRKVRVLTTEAVCAIRPLRDGPSAHRAEPGST